MTVGHTHISISDLFFSGVLHMAESGPARPVLILPVPVHTLYSGQETHTHQGMQDLTASTPSYSP
jgi:hypothetical protein